MTIYILLIHRLHVYNSNNNNASTKLNSLIFSIIKTILTSLIRRIYVYINKNNNTCTIRRVCNTYQILYYIYLMTILVMYEVFSTSELVPGSRIALFPEFTLTGTNSEVKCSS